MKRYIITLCIVLAGMACGGCGTEKALNVSDVASKPASIAGTVTVTGVMAARSQEDPAVFGIFDTRELSCSTPNCKSIVLPVRYQGKIPVPGDEVRVTGNFVRDVRGYLFVAEKLKVVKNHKQGGK